MIVTTIVGIALIAALVGVGALMVVLALVSIVTRRERER